MRLIHHTAALAALAGIGFAAHATTLKISCGAVGLEFQLCKDATEAWSRKTGHEVQVINAPNDSNERLALYQQVLGSGSDKVDIYQIDVVWPGLLASHFIDLKPYSKGAEKEHFPAIVANNTVGDKLVAMPWFVDAGLLFYRKDLLAKYKVTPPATWDELGAAAKKIQDAERAAGNTKMWGYVWQGRAYEGLSCNATEWLASFGAGAVVEPSGKVSVNNANAVKALETAAGWVGSITPKAVLNYGEEDSRGVFQAGNAVFLRNWPYVWALAHKPDSLIKDKVGVMPLPAGGANGRHAATLGGWQLSVSKYSKNQDLAAQLVMYLVGSQVQKERAIKASYNPTIPALYKDPEVVKANPFMAELGATFSAAVSRPSTVTASGYNQVSNLFWNASHDVISGKARASDAVAELERSLNQLAPGGKWN
jgi:trehalose/maltose transport system substrate-binding protein